MRCEYCGLLRVRCRDYYGCLIKASVHAKGYSLGFREGVMWVKAIAVCEKDAECGEDFREWCFFTDWSMSLEEGR